MIYLIGTGYMASEYSKVLDSINSNYTVLGNSVQSCTNFENSTGKKAVPLGIETILKFEEGDAFIVTVNADKLIIVCQSLLNRGAKYILVEKPGGLSSAELLDLKASTIDADASIYIAYNRRFYASVIQAKKIIKEDGGLISCSFDFTELSDEIVTLNKPEIVLQTWLVGNSSHVIDLAFYFTGLPEKLVSYRSGSLIWHKSASTFAGAGVSEMGVLFNFSANWDSAGRWGLELHTKARKLIFRPMEELKVINRGSFEVIEMPLINRKLDIDFKPGLYLQTQNFINCDFGVLKTLDQQITFVKLCEEIGGYT